ncbi:hypothetical protein BDN72DRAFT_849128 [Pluteus cervinus]|uniref:Uncharacterized protein n=1 Tax=Pluteus cervinus TaxID=181527 RepID=A0ACD3A824_9AGAR|nr:hypothetical protein BDN72DRAFT_849128 [Pluteus cervinus]
MPSWHFDILSFDWKSAEDEKGLLESTRKISELITAKVDGGLPANRVVVVGGFSQGAVISLLTGGERKLGGVVALGGWVPLRKSVASDVGPVPVFWTQRKRSTCPNTIESTSDEELRDLKGWVKKVPLAVL